MKTSKISKDEDTSLPLSVLRLIAPPLRLVSASMWKVMQQRDAVHYGKLEEIVTSICETVPGLLHYRHQARLSIGLRALLILEELRQSDSPDTKHVLQELDKLQASFNVSGRRKDLKVEEAKHNFCTLVHSLLKSPAARKQFFKENFHQHYGENYVASLEKLLWEFLIRLDQLLPVPDLAQTVSWLSAAPAVLEECARTATQPQLLRTLLQHESCLGHLGSTSLLSSTGDSILSSLSLPFSGRVQQTIQSESTLTSNKVISPSPSMPRATRRTAKEALSQIAPVIGSISNHSLQKNILTNKKLASSLEKECEPASGISKNTRSKRKSCTKRDILEKDPEEEYYVGNMFVTVINQSAGSEIEKDNRNDKGSDMKSNGERENIQITNLEKGDVMSKSPKNSEGVCSQEETNVNALLVSCMKRQLRVVIPRLNNISVNLPARLNHLPDEQDATRSPCRTNDTSKVRRSDSVKRKRKCTDWTPTPEKYLADTINKLSSACSPCIPPVLHNPMASPETPSSITDSTDDIIVDSEDEISEKVKRKVFTRRYCKTKNGTYVPTLQEFWNPAFHHRDIVSPGNRC